MGECELAVFNISWQQRGHFWFWWSTLIPDFYIIYVVSGALLWELEYISVVFEVLIGKTSGLFELKWSSTNIYLLSIFKIKWLQYFNYKTLWTKFHESDNVIFISTWSKENNKGVLLNDSKNKFWSSKIKSRANLEN